MLLLSWIFQHSIIFPFNITIFEDIINSKKLFLPIVALTAPYVRQVLSYCFRFLFCRYQIQHWEVHNFPFLFHHIIHLEFLSLVLIPWSGLEANPVLSWCLCFVVWGQWLQSKKPWGRFASKRTIKLEACNCVLLTEVVCYVAYIIYMTNQWDWYMNEWWMNESCCARSWPEPSLRYCVGLNVRGSSPNQTIKFWSVNFTSYVVSSLYN